MSLSILISVTHLLGVGHLTRMAAIGRALVRAGHRVTLISGGFPAPLVDMHGINLVQLPPLRSAGTDFTNLLDDTGTKADEPLFQARMTATRAALMQAAPDVVITELFPFGRRSLAREFIDLVETARNKAPRPLILASIRDILVAPAKPTRVAQTHARLRTLYDGVLVHGDPALTPLDASWPQAAEIADRLHYTGYIDTSPQAEGESEPDQRDSSGDILVSGGGSAAGLPLYRSATAAAALDPTRRWHILVGTATPDADMAALLAQAPDNAIVERARADFPALLARCAVSVSQAGYNTMIDLVAARARAVVVPFEQGRETEQRLRAECFAAHGLVSVLPEAELTPARLARMVADASARPRPSQDMLDRNGLATTVSIIERLTRQHRDGLSTAAVSTSFAAPHLASVQPDWSPLKTALARLKDAGRTLDVWWRDDDAISVTPALLRLLALSHSLEAPVALAAIPALTRADLVGHLLHDKRTSLLVHGLAHTNHAPPGGKKAEFGSHRALSLRLSDATAALARLRALTGGTVLPVFVPPWNRIAPDMLPGLAEIGFTGLSTFQDRPSASPTAGLCQINTHIDPVHWHGGGGLADADALIALTAQAIDTRRSSTIHELEPLGLLTHHLVQDAATWLFCASWLDAMRQADGAIVLVSAADLFPKQTPCHGTKQVPDAQQ